MVRGYWRDPKYWRFIWHNRMPVGAKLVLGAFAAAAFLVGGFVVADQLPRASAHAAALTYETTSEQPVTVREHGKTVVKREFVVRRVVLRPQTAFETRYDTRLVTTPGRVKTVPVKVVSYVPVIRRHVVTVNGKTTTLTETRVVPTTKIETRTQTNVVTNEQTVVNQNTVTVLATRNVPVPVTVRETRTETVVETETQPAVTMTLPVTITNILPVTVTLPVP
jgi:hypothetical protein